MGFLSLSRDGWKYIIYFVAFILFKYIYLVKYMFLTSQFNFTCNCILKRFVLLSVIKFVCFNFVAVSEYTKIITFLLLRIFLLLYCNCINGLNITMENRLQRRGVYKRCRGQYNAWFDPYICIMHEIFWFRINY